MTDWSLSPRPARDPARVSLAAVYRALAGEEPDVVTPAALDEAIQAAEEAYVAQLEPITLASLLRTDTVV